MLLTLGKSKQSLLLALVLLAFSACKQSEFYDKAALIDPSVQTGSNPGSDIGLPPANDPSGGTVSDPAAGGSSGGSDGGSVGSTDGGSTSGGSNGGTTTTPPPVVVITPPPVITDPIITDPVVTNPPVVTDPVVTNPPVVTDPVVVSTPKVDCVGSWGSCSVACGGGSQVYNISVQASGGGYQCSALQGASQACNVQACVNLVDRSEVFTQDSTRDGDVDILWVIDDSGSMADNQENLAKNFNSFIDQFLAKKIDFKMAITTTDGTSTRNGRMVGDSGMLTHASAIGNRTAFTNNFTKWVKVGTSGSGIEQGLKCASSFMDRYASSFLRQDAFLAVVFVSDEEDQSDKKVAEYLAKLQAVKKNAGMVKAYSIVTTKVPANAQWESVGNRYMSVTKSTGGTVADINGDFASALQNMGGSIVNLMDRFALAQSPYQDKIQVFVNNVEKMNGFTFDVATHSLKFNADSVPAEGAKIEVRYKVQATVLGAI